MMQDVILTALSKDELATLVAHQLDLAFQRYSPQSESRATNKIMSLAEFCEYAGLTKQTAYKLTSAQKVPHSKRGKRLYFDREKVDAWLLENQVATQTEINQKSKDYLLKSQNRRRM
jgi:excisionase family DNA binding protein